MDIFFALTVVLFDFAITRQNGDLHSVVMPRSTFFLCHLVFGPFAFEVNISVDAREVKETIVYLLEGLLNVQQVFLSLREASNPMVDDWFEIYALQLKGFDYHSASTRLVGILKTNLFVFDSIPFVVPYQPNWPQRLSKVRSENTNFKHGQNGIPD